MVFFVAVGNTPPSIRVLPPFPLGGDSVRKRHQCKSFQWYLKTVYPEMFIPNDPDMMKASGEIRNPSTGSCVDTLGARGQGAEIGAYPCHHNHGTQEFILTRVGEIRVASMDFDNCLDRGGHGGESVAIFPCHAGGGNQAWTYDEVTGQLADDVGNMCLEAIKKDSPKSPFTLLLSKCDRKSKGQEWRFKEY